jgi:hypothetical protein
VAKQEKEEKEEEEEAANWNKNILLVGEETVLWYIRLRYSCGCILVYG